MNDFNLTKHFRYSDFIRSRVAELYRIHNDVDSAQVMVNLILVARCLESLRSYGKPLVISSGFRCPELNGRVLGSPTSWHLQGLAVDLMCFDDDRNAFTELLSDFERSYPSLVIENYHGSDYVHVAFDYKLLLRYFR